MADTEHPEDITPGPDGEVPATKADMTVPEMRQWLRNWVGKAVGRSPDDIDESVPMVELGLSSRDAVAMAADIEDMTGVTLSVAVAFQHPTIESLATRIIEGEPEIADDGLDGADWTRTGPAERVDIAIVGLSTRLPGDMNSPDETWQALMEGRDAITDLPEGRWSEFLEEPRIAARVGTARTRGGYLKDIKGFDSEFFAVAKTEADNIDPQQRMALELTWEALEHARIPASTLRGEAVGVYVGFSNNDYQFLAVSDPTVAHPYAITGTASSIIANRVSYFYDFRGPSVALDTACSSSLVATHQAVQALRNGECDVAVAGGVNALLTPLVTLGFDEIGQVLSPDGRIKSFSSDADGYTRSEGGGMFVLKRVDDARRDGDQILAVIAGSAVNHDGRSNGLIAPNQDAQAEVLRRAYKDAGIDPRTVDYIEAHGTGTVLGDPIEAEALGRIVGRGRPTDRPALLGAVKTNVGHLESAAGAASLAKVVLALQHDKLPPSINFAGPSPYIDFDGMRLKVVDGATDWPRYGGYALAGVSSFGFGGANAHLVVREVLPRDVVEREAEPTPQADAPGAPGEEPAEAPTLEAHSLRFDDFGNIIPDAEAPDEEEDYELPGVTEEALRLKEIALAELAAQEESEPTKPLIPLAVSGFLTSRKKTAAADLADWMESPEGQASSLESIGRALSRRNHGRSRAVVLAHDHEEAIKGLRAVAEGKQRPNVFSTDGPVTSGPVWAMAGFGAQHRKMGKNLYLRNEVFAEWIEKVDALIQDERGYSVLELILDDSHEYGIETSNVVIFAIQIALGELLKHHGAKPAAVVGQSLGEPASAYFSGGLSLRDAARVIASRSHLMGEGEAMLFGEYIRLMALVEYSADELKTVFGDFPGLEVCVYAAPSQTVIGGPPEQIDAIVARCEAEGRFARKLQTKGAGHTSQMDPLLGEFSAELQGIKPMSPTVGIFSTVHEGSYVKPGVDPIHDVDYWVKGMRHSVYFTHGVRNAVDSGHTTFLELAPNPVALMQIGLTTAAAGLHDAQLIPTLAKKQDDVESMISAMAQLYVHGHDLDIRTLFSRRSAARYGPEDYANIPPTRFKRKEHWLDVHFSGDGSVIMPGTHVALPDGRHVWEYAPRNGETDLAALVRSAATQVLSDAQLVASEQRAVPGAGARLVTTMTRHPGGASVQVHARIDESFTLVYDALVSRAGQSVAALPTAVGAGAAIAAAPSTVEAPAAPAEEADAETLSDSLTNRYLPSSVGRWSPDSGETIADRLGMIVSAAMGYEPEDLPWEVPLVELGLDSLMAVRIKNRVEYDFDMPPIQLTAVRDANLYAVEKLIEYAVEHRDEVYALHEHQKTLTPEEIAKEQAELLSGATPASAAAPAPDPQAEPETQEPIPPPPTDPSGPAAATNGGQPNLAGALSQEAVSKALHSDVPPRDAAERVTFATWAIVTGKSPGGIFNPLPKLDEDTAAKMAQRLSERADGTITAEDVLASETIEALAEKVRQYLEAGQIDGFVRTIRAPENDSQVPVFVFHPAGGSTVVYEPLISHLPADIPVYGLERVEGTIQERAAQYVPKLLEMNGGKPFILAGWSLGGALAYACAIGLKRAGADVRFVGMIDTVRAGEEIPQTKEETRKRWDRYAKFAERTFNVEIPAIPYEELEELDDEGQVKFVLDIVQQSGVQIPGGIVEHQRTSYLDNRALETVVIEPYDGHVTLYMADRYHDDVIEFEPRYAVRQPDGGWGQFVADLEVVPIGGEHIQAIDEPIIAKVGAHLAEVLNKVDAETTQTSEVGK
ncbi:polyketide synthase Pks13 [Mycobacterium marseillense]|uniref:Polyketide synthase n=1 Tax=Mycobacterium marseillense TaxID=701042 RepID=A0ABN5ZX79_9MYCO|nr:polyketide synthase Pks13 [Mycobacterium marseillense]MCV7404912.1 type I polyketide synthase [Mycobacterium marseillense]ORA94945.1 polyketide synthase [Mycobacterium marseillense]BBY13067.1 polyketide synthase [Mycobacterium marseillense]